jgi:hypothetical protein
MISCDDRDISIRLAPAARRPAGRLGGAMTMLSLLLVGAGPVACSDQQTVTFRNSGRLCLYPAAETGGIPQLESVPIDHGIRTYGAGEPVNLAVQFQTCLSSSCSSDIQTSCTVSPAPGSADRLIVESYGSFRQKTSGACTDDCRPLIARCTSAALAAGNYTFQHADVSVPLTVPESSPAPCADAPAL